jgi:5'-nucleotidase
MRPTILLLALLTTLGCTTPAERPDDKHADGAHEQPAAPVAVRVLAFNDFHGNLVGPTGTVEVGGGKVEAGGVTFMARHLQKLREGHPHTVTVCAGDLIGASPLVSAMFHDEPTVEAMDLLGLDLCAVGNHEFDEGQAELLRIQNGGCHPVDGCKGKDAYTGAKFQYLGANVLVQATGQTLLPATAIKTFDGVKIGFIGLTLEATGSIVDPSGVQGLTFQDEIVTINKYVAELKADGAKSIIVLIHEGGQAAGIQDVNDCGQLSGPIVPIAKGVDPAVVALVSGHSHQLYNCVVDGRVVTSAKSYGRAITAIDLTIDPATGAALSATATNHAVTSDITPEALTSQLVARYRALVGPLAMEVVAQLTATITRMVDETGQSALGLLIADAQLAATRGFPASAQLALMNIGGVRADLRDSSGQGVTVEQIQRTQPFGNTLVTASFTGAQLKALLEEQFEGMPYNVLQPSASLTYTWSASAPVGSKVNAATLKIDGAPIDLAATYRVTIINYLANGGDGFRTLVQGTDRVDGGGDLDILIDYARANSPLSPPPLNRITKIP